MFARYVNAFEREAGMVLVKKKGRLSTASTGMCGGRVVDGLFENGLALARIDLFPCGIRVDGSCI